MKQFINKKALENTSFSAKTIGPLAYIVHKMTGTGSYFLEIYHNKNLVVRSEVACNEKYENTSENIDISKIFSTRILPKIRLNSENGYLLFYNSKEFSNHRIVIKKGRSIEFDNYKPSKADIYALNLLRPGVYNLKSKSLKSNLKVNVEYPSLNLSKEGRFSESLKISSTNFKKLKEQKVLPNQGLVFNLGNGFEDFNIEMVSENVPKKGNSIEDQMKVEAQKFTKVRKVKSKSTIQKKYQWEQK